MHMYTCIYIYMYMYEVFIYVYTFCILCMYICIYIYIDAEIIANIMFRYVEAPCNYRHNFGVSSSRDAIATFKEYGTAVGHC